MCIRDRDGVCLTAAEAGGDCMAFDISQETLRRTTIGAWDENHRVNLERPLAHGDEIGGHFVSGHVDGAVAVLAVTEGRGAHRVTFELPAAHAPYVARKGSVCVNGVSLTVNEATPESFTVNLIPHTLARTNLSELRAGSRVNLEVDLLGRYLARLLNR